MPNETRKVTDPDDPEVIVARARAPIGDFDLETRIIVDVHTNEKRVEIAILEVDEDGDDNEVAWADADDFFATVDRLRAFLVPREPSPAERVIEAMKSAIAPHLGGAVLPDLEGLAAVANAAPINDGKP